MTTPDLSLSERIVLAHFEDGEAAPESYVQQHRSNDDCWCEPYAVGTLGVMTHRVVEP